MTQPHDPYGQPSEPPSGQPPQWGQPQYPAPQYQPQPYQPQQYDQQPQYQPPQYEQPQYGPPNPAYPPTFNDPAQWGYQPQPPAKRKRGGLIAGAVAVVLVAGAGATYVAVSNKSNTGAGSPQKAVSALVADLDKSDLIGALDHLPPAERDSLVDPITDEVSQLKRVKVLDGSADPKKVAGFKISVTGLKFSGSPEKINDHLQVVTVADGKVTVTADLDKIPYTKEFLQIVFANRSRPTGTRTRTVDLSTVAGKTGNALRIATEKVGGKWYPSLFYTIADNAVHAGNLRNPTSADYVPAAGGSSAEDAVKRMATAIGMQDYAEIIKLMPPEEMAVLHDYAGVILRAAKGGHGDGQFSIEDLKLTSKDITGGKLVSATGATIKTTDGMYSYEISGDCVTYKAPDDSGKYCSSDAITEIAKHTNLTDEEKAALQRLFTALPKIGVVVVQEQGKWYVSPVRTYGELFVNVLSELQDNDVLTLLKLAMRQ